MRPSLRLLGASLASSARVGHAFGVDPQRRALLALQLTAGPLVLVSYVVGFVVWPDATAMMWGGVPESLRGLYTTWMFVAAAGYFAYSIPLTFRAEASGARMLGGRGYPSLLAAYALMLVPSALWLPLTKWHLGDPSALRFAVVCVDLLAVALGSLAILGATLTLEPRLPARARILSVAGAAAFCVQTVLLDGLLWPALWLVRGPGL